MNKQITINIKEMPKTCFDCPFSYKWYFSADCPFLNTTRDDGECVPSDCPLKEKNKNKIYSFNSKIYKRYT